MRTRPFLSTALVLAAIFIHSFLFFASNPALAWEKSPKPSVEVLKKKLTPLQFDVTQKSETERPFKNEYWDNHREGIYVDIVSGEPLFSSKDKFESGTGWPSFTRPLVKENLVEKEDRGLLSVRTEIRSKHADSHVGHVFDDGPPPTGKRYCMNSAALRFVPKENLAKEGYPEFVGLFSGTGSSSGSGAVQSKIETAIFAGGCFWCMQPPYEALKAEGVLTTVVGYTGGRTENPTYEQTSSGGTGHREAIEVTYDPAKISYKKLLDVFWKNIDPLDKIGQFCDKGEQYTSAVYYTTEEQKRVYEQSLAAIRSQLKVSGEIATVLLPGKKFYPAEEYHQKYSVKNPVRYTFYRTSCGRDARLKQVWGSSPH